MGVSPKRLSRNDLLFLKNKKQQKHKECVTLEQTERDKQTEKTGQEWRKRKKRRKAKRKEKPNEDETWQLEKCSGDFRRPLEETEGTTSQMYLFIWMRTRGGQVEG